MTEWVHDLELDEPDVFDADEIADGRSNASLTGESGRPLVRRLVVKGLFGRYDYDLNSPGDVPGRLLLLYGENGAGKTNLLRLIWHLLSPAPNRHHRQSLARMPFSEMQVHLSNGSVVTATKLRSLEGAYTLQVDGREHVPATEWPSKSPLDDWSVQDIEDRLPALPDDLKGEARRAMGQKKYLHFIHRLGANPLFLADDRNIYSDDFSDTTVRRERDEWQRRLHAGPARYQLPDDTQSLVAREAETAIRRASDVLRQLTLGGTTSGSASANSVYLEVLQRLSSAAPQDETKPRAARASLQKRLREVGERSRPYEDLGLVPALSRDDFLRHVRNLDDQRVTIAEEVIGPYLSSLNARLDALQEAQQLITVFLNEVNGFLTDKSVKFSPRQGLRIEADGASDRLSATQLSSGERQLLLLMCNALLAARQGSRLFLIDEPELSLNVKWQRRIGSALLNVTSGSPLQFIVATHSIELLSKFRDHVIPLRPETTVG
ncbi:MAG TPA: AAA family ATPase [Ardenticatenaceae bacterium]|nr:AAA family ATPase [Ardenticatenaceae bacterium]